ncbi:MAG TPA: helix-hairpin-helix domain-containing protein [Bacteroidia bacterium]|nr:helix-hairpin-helix domain-containing protein [Bacteroidia bacterium]
MKFSKLKFFIRDYFTLTSRERRGALMLAIIILIQLACILWLNYTDPSKDSTVNRYKIELIHFENEINSREKSSPFSKNETVQADYKKGTFNKPSHQIDPNKLTDAEWISLGMSQKQTATIRNYLNKGGAFREKGDLLKIYGITSEQFSNLEPYMEIPKKNNEPFRKSENKVSAKKVFHKININTADTIELLELPMVGTGRARLIYKYRESLGGFVEINQLLEVFGLDSATYEKIKPLIETDTTNIRKFNINDDNLKHPYVSRQLSKVIKAYRKQHGNFTHITELKQISLLTDQFYSKLVPYVAFE